MRAAIYARYSSDNQRDASIEDQVRECKKRIDHEGWSLTEVFSDHAVSGASVLRSGYQQMLENARNGTFDILISEALDRLSRDQEDIAGLYKQLSFADVQIITLSEGEINELHVGLKGTMNALFLKDLAQKTHRGLEGRVLKGKSGGGRAYGYDVPKTHDQHGERVRGNLSINQAEALVVRHIFDDYTKGKSPRAIAIALNKAGTAAPSGKGWTHSTVIGNRKRGTGILNNQLYVGKRVWNRLRYRKDPTTGKRVSKLNPPEAWIVTDVPDLRIIDDALWNQAQELQNSRTAPAVAHTATVARSVFSLRYQIEFCQYEGVNPLTRREHKLHVVERVARYVAIHRELKSEPRGPRRSALVRESFGLKTTLIP